MGRMTSHIEWKIKKNVWNHQPVYSEIDPHPIVDSLDNYECIHLPHGISLVLIRLQIPILL